MTTPENESSKLNTGKRLAIVIGVNHAPNSQLPPLKYAAADAMAMAEVLQQHCNFELLEPPLLNEQATSDQMKKAVRRLAKQRADGDFLLVYFSGYGQLMTVEADRPDVYFVTSDFNEIEVEEDEDVHCSMHWLSEKLFKATNAGRVLVVLDCCYAGNIGRTGSDPYLEEVQARIKKYLGAPSAESSARSGGLRLALTATGHNTKASERDGQGLMTGLLLPALRGEVDAVLEGEIQGQVSIQRLHRYLEITMPPEQKPSLSGDFAGRSCILASFPERAAQLRRKSAHRVVNERPTNYLPFPRSPLYQPRPGEFEQLEALLFGPGTEQQPARLGLVGVVGMGGVGKTQLAVELAYRCLDQQRFPAGTFWMLATGTSVFEWQLRFAELAFYTDYLLPDDDPSSQENEARRARHFCRYLATHKDALLILDNIEDPNLVTSILPALAGVQVECPILYTSRNQFAPPGVSTYHVRELPTKGSLRLLLETTRPTLLDEVLAGSISAEAQAAHTVCRDVGYLPLALVQLRGLLARDRQVTLVRLAEMLKQRGALEVVKTQQGDAAPLFATFLLSWEKVGDENARYLFKLASYFPEATSIPLWLLGLASGLGENTDILEPLGEARLQLQAANLIEVLSGELIRLHPLLREFGRRLVTQDSDGGKTLVANVEERLLTECANLHLLEQRAQRESYWGCLEQVRTIREYVEQLGTVDHAELVRWIERWLDREGYLLGDERWWPKILPGLFYQQLFNRSIEEEHPVKAEEAPTQWLKQLDQVGAEDRSLLKIFAGHTGGVTSVAFSPDGRQILTGSDDRSARLWETGSGKLLLTLQGHTSHVTSVMFSLDGRQILTGSDDRSARLWETGSGKLLMTLQGHIGGVTSVAFSPDGKLVLTGSYDGTARLWETGSGKLLTILMNHTDWVSSVAFSPDGKLVLTGSYDGTARLWETGSGKTLGVLQGHTERVMSVIFSPDGRQILTGSDDRTARLWKMENGKVLDTFQDHPGVTKNAAFGVTSVAFSPDGKLVLTGSYDGTARLWETGSGKLLMTLQGHIGGVTSVAFSPDGKLVLTGSYDGTARLWETGSGKTLGVLQGHTRGVNSVAFSFDGRQILTGSDDGTARLWEAGSGKTLSAFQGHTSGVKSVAFSSDGRQILTGSDDRTVRLWETGSRKLLAILQGHTGSVKSVAFSPLGKQVITGSDDGTARLWDMSDGKLMVTLQCHTGGVKSVVFSPDGHLAIACDGYGQVLFWISKIPEMGHLFGIYVATFEVGAVYWQNATHLILADTGGSQGWPHFYRLALQGVRNNFS